MRPSTALAALTDELARRDEQGLPAPPCTSDDRFISEQAHEREQTVPLCEPCPVRAVCAEAGRRASWGVWGGIDQSTSSVTKTKKPKKEGKNP